MKHGLHQDLPYNGVEKFTFRELSRGAVMDMSGFSNSANSRAPMTIKANTPLPADCFLEKAVGGLIPWAGSNPIVAFNEDALEAAVEAQRTDVVLPDAQILTHLVKAPNGVTADALQDAMRLARFKPHRQLGA